MAIKVAIDAGHGGSDPGAVFEGRREKEDVLELALAVGELLEDRGVDVVYTRTEDFFDTPFEKAQIANRANADYFVSFHRNSAAPPAKGSGAEVLVYPGSEEGNRLAGRIQEQLVQLGFADRGIVERPNLVVLKRTKMPAVLVEVGFIDSEEDNERFDRAFDELAEGITEGILSVALEKDAVPERKLYRVQVGAFRNRANADRLLSRLNRDDIPAFLLYEDGIYRVQAGAFSQLDNAVRMEQDLRRRGYMTFIST